MPIVKLRILSGDSKSSILSWKRLINSKAQEIGETKRAGNEKTLDQAENNPRTTEIKLHTVSRPIEKPSFPIGRV